MSENRSGMAVGFIAFAAVMMIMMGTFEAFNGLAAIIKDEFFVTLPNYAFNIDTTTWGWVHLILGAVTIAAGFALFSGAVWARTVGVILAVLIAIENFAFVPFYPVWAILVITTCVIIVWALTAHGRDMVDE
jgi:hypothetical protein